MTNGEKVISAYFLLFYCLPLIGNLIYKDKIISIYQIYPLNSFAIAFLAVVYLLYLCGCKIRFRANFNFISAQKLIHKCGLLYIKFRWLIALIAVFIGISNYFLGWKINSFRYAMSLTERNSWLLFFIIALNVVITVDMFYTVFIENIKKKTIVSRWSLENILLSVALIMLANGAATAFLGIAALVFSFFPRIFRGHIFTKINDALSHKTIKFFFTMMAIAVIIIASTIIGEAIKAESNEVTSDISFKNFSNILNSTFSESNKKVQNENDSRLVAVNNPVNILEEKDSNNIIKYLTDSAGLFYSHFDTNYFYYLVERFSVNYYSYLMTTEFYKDNNGANLNPILFPIRSFLFRANFILGGLFDVNKPEITSLSQLNYRLLVSRKPNLREGSSPGLLGSFNYIFSFPFNIFFCVIYLCALSKMIDTLLTNDEDRSLSIPGIILFFAFIQVYFESPFDFLLLIDNAFIYVFLIFCIFLQKKTSIPQDKSISVVT